MAVQPLKYHQPGWSLSDGEKAHIVVWLPGPVTDDGFPTDKVRDEVSVSIEADWRGDNEDGDWSFVDFRKFPTVDEAVAYLSEFDHLGTEEIVAKIASHS